MSRSSGAIVTGGGGGGATVITQEDGVLVNPAADTLNFLTGFDLANGPGTRTNIGMDLSEYNLAPLPIVGGGTGQSGKTAAFDALSPLTTRGDVMTHDGTDSIRLPLGVRGKALNSNGTDPLWTPGARSLVAIGGFTSVNTFASSTLIGGPVACFPADWLAQGDTIDVTAAGTFFNNSGAAATMGINFFIAGVQITQSNTISVATAATSTRQWILHLRLSVVAAGAILTQVWGFTLENISAANANALVVANSLATGLGNTTFGTNVATPLNCDIVATSTVSNVNTSASCNHLSVTHIPAY